MPKDRYSVRQTLFVDVRQGCVILTITKHLLGIAFVVGHLHVGDVAFGIGHRLILRIDKTFVRSQVQFLVTFEYLGMQFGIDLHGIVFDQLAGTFEVACRLDALDFGQQFAEEGAHPSI